MQLFSLKTSLIKPKDAILPILLCALKKSRKSLREGDLVVISSKVVALAQNRVSHLPIEVIIRKEADVFLGGKPYSLTLKEGILIPRAGIDESNSPAGEIILWPKHSWQFAQNLRQTLAQRFKLKNLGVLITDSTSRPLRLGVTGIAIAWAGFVGILDARGRPDLFGKKLRVTQIALADALASAANVLMGEAQEGIPFVLIRRAPLKFCRRTVKPKKFLPQECLYQSIYKPQFRKLTKIEKNGD